MNKFQIAFMIGISSVMFTACNRNTDVKETAGSEDSLTTSVAQETDIVYQDGRIDTAYSSYISLKNALVASNVADAQKSAGILSGALNQIEGCKNTADIAERISKSQKLDQQRKDFTLLSDDLIALMKHADIKEGSVYVQYCPMANSGKGGYWMASTDEVRNPYYGDEMLNCGEVKEVFSKK
ncbi:DUF3347 domain-containing protein [Flavihumibacter sp. R14]|nr:DUF3347 domain-containing protein [Flavihumibacter soli]